MVNGKSNLVARRGVALIMTLLLVVLLVTSTARLATTTSIEAIHSNRQACTLQHELAVDSTLQMVATYLENDELLLQTFDRTGVAHLDFEVGNCVVHCEIRNDAAKLNVSAFAAKGQEHLLRQKLNRLKHRLPLPAVTVKLRPVENNNPKAKAPQFYWFDQLFKDSPLGAYFDHADSKSEDKAAIRCWSDVVTFFGNSKVDIRHVEPEVLRVVLEDLDRSAATAILNRKLDKDQRSLEELLLDRDSEAISKIAGRICSQSNRYALTITTAIGGDRRQWYVVTEISKGEIATTHYREQIQW